MDAINDSRKNILDFSKRIVGQADRFRTLILSSPAFVFLFSDKERDSRKKLGVRFQRGKVLSESKKQQLASNMVNTCT